MINDPLLKTIQLCGTAERLINNRDYWEIIDVQTIIVMSIIHMVYKKSLHYAGCFDAKCIKTSKLFQTTKVYRCVI